MGPDPQQVQEMFARVAHRYDRANRLLSAGVDRSWRRAAVEFAGARAGEAVLDTCTGTGDLALCLKQAGLHVTGADFCQPMLQLARQKGQTGLVAADSLHLPFPSNTFDLATVAFGIRNLEDPTAGLREMARVVRPGGRIMVLEFCKPKSRVFGPFYMFYFRRVLPRLGGWIAGDKKGAYSYLQESVMGFPEREGFLELLRNAGLQSPQQKILSLGIAALYRAEVPAA